MSKGAEAQRRFRRKAKDNGVCRDCGGRIKGSEGTPTATRCGYCADVHRTKQRKRDRGV